MVDRQDISDWGKRDAKLKRGENGSSEQAETTIFGGHALVNLVTSLLKETSGLRQ